MRALAHALRCGPRSISRSHIAAGAVRMRHEPRQPAGADDQHVACVVAGQIAGRQQRSRCSAAQRQRFAIDDGARLATVAIEQHIKRVDRRQAARAIAGQHGHELDADGAASDRRSTPASTATNRSSDSACAWRSGATGAGPERLRDRIGQRGQTQRSSGLPRQNKTARSRLKLSAT